MGDVPAPERAYLDRTVPRRPFYVLARRLGGNMRLSDISHGPILVGAAVDAKEHDVIGGAMRPTNSSATE